MAAVAKGPTKGNCSLSSFSDFQEQLWPVLVLEFVVAVVGNGAALHGLARQAQPWHAGTIFACHLATGDLLYALALPALAAYYYPPKHWRYGSVLCKLERFLFTCTLYGGIFLVACLSLLRYAALVHPLATRGRLGLHRAHLLSGAVWLLAAMLSAPTLHFSGLQLHPGNTTECLGTAPFLLLPSYLPYSLVLAGVGCGLPGLLTLFCCGAVARAVLRSPGLAQGERRQAWVLVGVGAGLYAVSYLPYHVLRNLNLWRRLWAPAREDCRFSQQVHAALQLSKVLVTFHICAHPLLYAPLANSLRRCCAQCPHGPPQGEALELQGGRKDP
ncbi:P2Y purinoceptor 11 [Alligator mississippiensis]|uniref:P2Y purinoceptor 11 n=1 Tax=Alligator mississippiensis TaxID=8496 RepID=UPI0007113FDA|nr:P2Y purinoceptor 11 [Alligator mississippiensis]